MQGRLEDRNPGPLAGDAAAPRAGPGAEQPTSHGRFFRDLLGVTIDEFLLNVADREAYGPHPSAARLQAADLAAMADIDQVLGHARFRGTDVEVFRNGRGETDGRTIATGARADAAYIYGLFRQGLSLRFFGVHRFLPRVAGFAAKLNAALGVPVNANIYLAPPKGQGLGLHQDLMDVFVVQCSGSKTWRLYAREPSAGEREGRPRMKEPAPRIDEPVPCHREVEMTPGDILYLPTGIRHRAAAPTGESLHLSFSVRTLTGADLARRALRLATEEGDWLRAPIPRAMRLEAAVAEQLVAELAAALCSRNLTAALQQYRREGTRKAALPREGLFSDHRDAAVGVARLGAVLADRVRRFGMGRH